MSWIGKLAGAGIGYWIFGWVGAGVGALLGHFLDRFIGRVKRVGGRLLEVQSTFFETTFTVLGYVCKADGQVTQAEIRTAEQIMTQMRLTQSRRREAIEAFNRGKATDFDPEPTIRTFVRVCGSQPALLRVFLEIQIQAAFADGQIAATEREALMRIAQALGLTDADFARLEALLAGHYQRGPGAPTTAEALENAYQALGVTRSATDAELKRAYRKLMSEHHPDKLIAKGLPDSMIELAKERSQEIQNAYETVRRSRQA
ncbi:MAG: co-chaperone DjlA [Halothiobacillaceae bacterium]|nr:co-chaperone DjlA [Halothiobacillaceae bacterium]